MDATAAFAYFFCHPDVEVVNYSSTMVDLAVAAMANNSSHHIVGLTQETYNADDDNDEVVDFHKHNDASFLVAWQSTSARIMTAHEILAPRLKKLASLYEHKPFKLIEFAAVLDQWIQKGEAENAATQRKPVGHIISALAPNNQVQLTHNKQKKHH
jgi:transcription-repair coupling factor (superfamily II helicase)